MNRSVMVAIAAILGTVAIPATGAFAAEAKAPGAPPAAAPSGRNPASATAAPAIASTGANGSKEFGQALDIRGQSRNLSMGLMFQKDKDKLSFATPRTNYRDKVTVKQSNF